MFLFRFFYNSIRFGFRLMLVGIFAVAIGLVAYTFFWLPDVTFLKDKNPETTAFMEQARARYRSAGLRTQIRYTWVPLEKISPHLVDAVLVAEDDRFFQHRGFDLVEIRQSIEENIREQRWARGGSSLSQQLAKNLFLTPTKSLRRKFDEMLITWKLESTLTKNRILELYLNVVDWGGGCFGAQEASLFYFSKNAASLNMNEAASLAARLPNPDLLNSEDGEDKRKKREETILTRLKGKGPGELHGRNVIAQQARQRRDTRTALAPGSLPSSPSAREMAQQVTQIGTSFKDQLGDFLKKLDQIHPKTAPSPPEEPPRSVGGNMNTRQASPEARSTPPSLGWKPITPQSGGVSSASREEKFAKGEVGGVLKGAETEKTEPQAEVSRSKKLKESLRRLEKVLGH